MRSFENSIVLQRFLQCKKCRDQVGNSQGLKKDSVDVFSSSQGVHFLVFLMMTNVATDLFQTKPAFSGNLNFVFRLTVGLRPTYSIDSPKCFAFLDNACCLCSKGPVFKDAIGTLFKQVQKQGLYSCKFSYENR